MILTGSGSLIEASGDWRGIDSGQFLAGAMDIEQPFDPSPFGVASTLPMREFTAQGVAVFNMPVQALLTQYPNFNLHHIEPTGGFNLHHIEPTGGSEHATATSNVSSRPVSLRLDPTRGCSLNAISRPSSTNRRLVRYTVDVPTPTVVAIAASP